MKKFIGILSLVVLSHSIKAELIRFRAGALTGRLNSETIEITDKQAVMNCHYNLSGKSQEVMKYPATYLKKIEGSNNSYIITTKAMSLFEALPHLELTNCAYKLILIGKNKSTYQTSFGEIYLFGTEHGKMSEKDLEILQNKEQLTKILNERIKDLSITLGNDGGIIVVKSTEE